MTIHVENIEWEPWDENISEEEYDELMSEAPDSLDVEVDDEDYESGNYDIASLIDTDELRSKAFDEVVD